MSTDSPQAMFLVRPHVLECLKKDAKHRPVTSTLDTLCIPLDTSSWKKAAAQIDQKVIDAIKLGFEDNAIVDAETNGKNEPRNSMLARWALKVLKFSKDTKAPVAKEVPEVEIESKLGDVFVGWQVEQRFKSVGGPYSHQSLNGVDMWEVKARASTSITEDDWPGIVKMIQKRGWKDPLLASMVVWVRPPRNT